MPLSQILSLSIHPCFTISGNLSQGLSGYLYVHGTEG